MEKWGDKEQKGDKSETSGASGFGCERTVSPGTASSKKLQKVLCSGCLSGAELSVMKFPEGEILAKPWVHQQVIHTPAFCFAPPLSWLFACLLRALKLLNTKFLILKFKCLLRTLKDLYTQPGNSHPPSPPINSAFSVMGEMVAA